MTRRQTIRFLFWCSIAALVVLPVAVSIHLMRVDGLNSELFAAIEQNDSVQVRRLLRAGADPNARQPTSRPTALLDVIRSLLDQARKNPTGDSALIVALSRAYVVDVPNVHPDNTAVVDALLHGKADPNLASQYGEPPLMAALVGDNGNEVPYLLMTFGANVNSTDAHGRTCLMESYDARLTAELIRRGADINAQDGEGNTALMHQADQNPSVAMITQLLSFGATVDQRNNLGYTALREAAFWNRSEMVRLLIRHGADVNALDSKRRTILKSIVNGNASKTVIKELKQHGAHE